MPAIMATGKDLKRVQVFIGKNPNGTYEVKKGSIYQAMGGDVLGGTPIPSRVAETERGVEEKKEE